MKRSTLGGVLLAVWGLLVIIGGGLGYNPSHGKGLARDVRWLMVVLAILFGVALLVAGGLVFQRGIESLHETRFLERLLAGLGLGGIVGGLLGIQPWVGGGLGGFVRMASVAPFLLFGGVALGVGLTASRRETLQLTVVCLALVSGAGAVYPLFAAGLLDGLPGSVMAAVVAVLVAGPPVVACHTLRELRG